MVTLMFMMVVLSVSLLGICHVMDQTRKGKTYPFLDKIAKRFF